MVLSHESGPADGEAVIFVHGAGMAGWMWDAVLDSAEGKRILVVDLPDHGLARGEPFPSIEAAAGELAALARERGGPLGAHLVGHSLGARIALEALARHPGSVRSAVLSSALVRPSALVSLMNSRALGALSVRMLKRERLARLQARQFRFPTEEMERAYVASVRVMSVDNLARPIAAFAEALSLPAGLDKAGSPVLVTVGSREAKGMLASARDIAAALPGTEVVTVPGADHCYPWAEREAYGRILKDWLSAR